MRKRVLRKKKVEKGFVGGLIKLIVEFDRFDTVIYWIYGFGMRIRRKERRKDIVKGEY